jgi:phosphate transport system protein
MPYDVRHTSRTYESELQELRKAVVAMGRLCQRALATALNAFHEGSCELTEQVQEFDREIDASEMAIDALVVKILALRQPVASDLRFLAMTLKLVTDLERIGDEAVNIAERATDKRCEPDPSTRDALEKMSAETGHMLAEALEAFVAEDEPRAERVLLRDDVVDALYGLTIRGMQEHMARHPAEVPAALAVISIAKYLERIADHATNVAEEVIYVARGEDVRHHRATSSPQSHRALVGVPA